MKGKKLLPILLIISMLIGLLSGCTPNLEGKALLSAFLKSQDIKSQETKTNMSIELSGSFKMDGKMPQDEVDFIRNVMPLINNSKMEINTKLNQNDDKTKAQTQIDASINLGGKLMDLKAWLDSDISGTTPYIKGIVRMPEELTMNMPPQLQGKDYVVLDLNELSKIESAQGVQELNYAQMMNENKVLQEKAIKFIEAYFAKFDPGFNFISYEGEKTVVTPEGSKNARIYKVKLDDNSIKALVKYMVNDFVDNKETRDLVKDYLLATVELSGTSVIEKTQAKQSIETMFKEIENSGPSFSEEFNKEMDKLKDVKIFGSKGIEIEYAIDSEGYIINKKGVVNFVINTEKLSSLLKGSNSAIMHQGVYNLEFNFDEYAYNINKDIKIELPQLTSENSVSYVEYIKSLEVTKVPEKKPVVTKPAPTPPIKKVSSIVIPKKTAKLYGKTYYVPIDTALKPYATYSKQVVTIKANGKTAVFKVGVNAIVLNGKTVKLDSVNAKIIGGKVYVSTKVLTPLGINTVIK